MQPQEVISMLRWINEQDPRVQFNDSAVEFWHYSLRTVDAAIAKQAVLEHVKQHEGIPVTPAAIAKRAGYIKSSRDGFRSATAIEASPTHQQQNAQDGQLFKSWRDRNREEWDRLVKQGAAFRKADLEARGLPSHFPGRAV
jgi:spore cortex formation protein SpoVR/YcgB (stage V sporulation)